MSLISWMQEYSLGLIFINNCENRQSWLWACYNGKRRTAYVKKKSALLNSLESTLLVDFGIYWSYNNEKLQ